MDQKTKVNTFIEVMGVKEGDVLFFSYDGKPEEREVAIAALTEDHVKGETDRGFRTFLKSKMEIVGFVADRFEGEDDGDDTFDCWECDCDPGLGEDEVDFDEVLDNIINTVQEGVFVVAGALNDAADIATSLVLKLDRFRR